jgi:hypothetical protein
MDQRRITARVADIVLDRKYRRDPDHTNMLAEVQASFGEDVGLASLILSHLLWVRQELGEDAVRQVRESNRRALMPL